MRQDCQRLLKVRDGVAVRGASSRLGPRLMEVHQGLLPVFASERVVGKPIHLLGQTVLVQRFDGYHDSRMEGAAPILEETRIGNFMGEGVLEGVLEVGKQARLVEELASLQMSKALAKLPLWQVADGLDQRKEHILADDCGSLEEPLLVRREAVDAGG